MARLTERQVERFNQLLTALESTLAALNGLTERLEGGAVALEDASETLARLESLHEYASDAREIQRRAYRQGYDEGWHRRGELQRKETLKCLRN